ncbi:MAG: PmbA/TldA family metallopeptidase, partial [Terriglobia bacterium]
MRREWVMTKELGEIAARLVEKAGEWGAEQSEVWIQESTQLSTTVRLGQVETLTEATSRALTLRVFVGHRVARASSSDLSWETLEALTRGAIARARLASEDAFAGLPDASSYEPYG